jgi:Gas vesicle synthesis protein GvpL/GvpF
MINVYAVATEVPRALDWTGVEGARVELVSRRALVAAISRHGSAPVPSRAAILAHAAVCEELLRVAGAVLPVRFGAAYNSDAALHASLDDRHDALAAALDHVRGRVEVGVRVRWDDVDGVRTASADRADSGRAYLMARVERERRRLAREERAEAMASELHRALAWAAAGSRVQTLATSGLLMSGAYLVDRGDIDWMVAAVRAVARQHPEFEVLCTGPWPPYHFADPEVSNA